MLRLEFRLLLALCSLAVKPAFVNVDERMTKVVGGGFAVITAGLPRLTGTLISWSPPILKQTPV